MAIRNLGTLEKVHLREIWPHEAHNFTRWLAANLGKLEEAVKLKLELIQPEHWLAGAGYVDVLAMEVNSGRKVVIENQLDSSDDDHFARLIGYAASRDAGVLIWIASEFHEWHRAILSWLNRAGVEIFGVKVSAFRIGELYAPWFETIVGPDHEANRTDSHIPGGPTIFGRFYPPLTGELRSEGIHAMGGRQGGWTGRYRRFRSLPLLEDAGVTFYTTIGRGADKSSAGIDFRSNEHSSIFDALYVQASELQELMGDIELNWHKGELESYVWAQYAGIADDEDESWEATRNWMKNTLVRYREAFQPKVEEIVQGLGDGVYVE